MILTLLSENKRIMLPMSIDSFDFFLSCIVTRTAATHSGDKEKLRIYKSKAVKGSNMAKKLPKKT